MVQPVAGKHGGAIDLPPPILSNVGGKWRPRKQVHRTMTKLVCLGLDSADSLAAAPSSPIIMGGVYVVVPAMNPASICVFKPPFHQNAKTSPTFPTSVVALGGEASIVCLAAPPFGKSVIFGDHCNAGEGHLLVCTDEGQCFVLRIGEESGVVFSFSTLNFGTISCASVYYRGGEYQLAIGYQSGHLESWRLFRSQKGDANSRIVAKLSWRGIFQINRAIRGVAPLRIPSSDSDCAPEAGNASSGSETFSFPYLVVSLLSSMENSMKPNEMVEVIEIDSLKEGWKSRDSLGNLSALNLQKHCLLPGVGMELLASTTQKPHWIPTAAAGFACALSTDASAAAAVAFADGTVAAISTSELNGSCWGIASDFDQVLLAYPCMGCAPVEYRSGKRRTNMPHLACSLRGGSTYLIPVGREHGAPDVSAEISIFSLPHCDEVGAQYLQGFTAGNITVDSSAASVPVFVYVWAGGGLDIYTPDFRDGRGFERDSVLISEIIANGSARLLVELLGSLQIGDDLLRQKSWKDAWDECNRSSPSIDAGGDQSKLHDKPAIRHLLFVLATRES